MTLASKLGLALLIGAAAILGRKAGGPLAAEPRADTPGIVSLELAGTPEAAQRVLSQWSNALARRAIYWDFGYILAYASLMAIVCRLMTPPRSKPDSLLVLLAVPMALLQLTAGVLDGIENVALLRVLGGHTAQPWPRIAQVCASIKFALLGGGVAYIVSAALSRLVSALR